MAPPTTKRWTALTLWPGDGNSPEDFTKNVCGMRTKSFSINPQISESKVPDCDDPDEPAWIERVVNALSIGFEASGVLANESGEFYEAWAFAGEQKNALIVIEGAAGRYFSGPFIISNYQVTGNMEGEGKLTVTFNVQSAGKCERIAGAPGAT